VERAVFLVVLILAAAFQIACRPAMGRWLDERWTPARQFGMACLLVPATFLLIAALGLPGLVPSIRPLWERIVEYPAEAVGIFGFVTAAWMMARSCGYYRAPAPLAHARSGRQHAGSAHGRRAGRGLGARGRAQVPTPLARTDLSFMWRPATVLAFVVLFYAGGVAGVLASGAGRSLAGAVQAGLAAGCAAVLVALVWPWCEVRLPKLIRGEVGAEVAACWVALLAPGAVLAMLGRHGALSPVPPSAAGWALGFGTLFVRLYRWLARLPE
jgi:hypothetical protein